MASKGKVAAAAAAKLPPVKLLSTEQILQYAFKEAEATAAAFSIIELLIDRGVRQIVEQEYESRAIELTSLQAVEAVLSAVDQRTLHLKRDRGEVFNPSGTSWFDTAGHVWDCEPEPMRCPIDRLARQAIEKIEAPQRIKASPPVDSRISSPNQHMRHCSIIASKARSSHVTTSQPPKRGNSAAPQPPPVPAPYPLPIPQPSPRDEAGRIALLNTLRLQQAEKVRLATEAAQAAALALQNKQAEERSQMQLVSQRRQSARVQAKKALSPKASPQPHPISNPDHSLSQTILQPSAEHHRRSTVLANDKAQTVHTNGNKPDHSRHSKDQSESLKQSMDTRKIIKHKSSIVEEQKQQIIPPHVESDPQPLQSVKSPLARTSSMSHPVVSQSISPHGEQHIRNNSLGIAAERKQPLIRTTQSTTQAVNASTVPLPSQNDRSSLPPGTNQSVSASLSSTQSLEQPPKIDKSRIAVKPANGKKSNKKTSGEPHDEYVGPAALLESIMAAMIPATGVTMTYESDTRAGAEIASAAPTAHLAIPVEDDEWDRAVSSLSLSQYRNWQEQRFPRSVNVSPAHSQKQSQNSVSQIPASQSAVPPFSSNSRPPTALSIPDTESYEETKEQIGLPSPCARESIVVNSHPPHTHGNGRKLSFDSMMMQSTNWGQRQSVQASSTHKPAGGVILPLIHNRLSQGQYDVKNGQHVTDAQSRSKMRLPAQSSAPSKSRPITPGEVVNELGDTWLNVFGDRR